VPERLRGEMAKFDIVGKDGKVIVGKDKRITARHVRELADGGVKKIAVPAITWSAARSPPTSSTSRPAR